MDVRQLLAQFSPYCFFHKKETAFPISYETLLENSQLQLIHGDESVDMDEQYKSMIATHTPAEIITLWVEKNDKEAQEYEEAHLKLALDVDAPGMAGDVSRPSNTLNSLPTYTQVATVSLANEQGQRQEYYRLTYLFIYANNEPSYAFGTGKHHGDIEHVTMYVRRLEDGSWDDSVEKMYYSAHGKFEGAWHSKDDIEYHNNQPVIHVARGSHADYASLKEGTQFFSSTHYIWRIFAFANDQISENHIGYQITRDDLRPMPKPIKENDDIEIGQGVNLGKDYIKNTETIYQTNRLVRQLPTTLSLGPFTFWDPVNHLDSVNHQEQVHNLLELDNNKAPPVQLIA